jgi:hypothetical protein
LLQAVCTGLAEKGFDILVDNGGQLYAGVDWELRINEWMAECHAAVILFSTAALRDSDWVKKEAAILSWRRELQKDFVLIPVLLEGITPEDLEQGLYRILRITKSQCIRNANTAQQIADKVALGLPPAMIVPMTPFERLQRVLSKILKECADPEMLEYAWSNLDGDNKPELCIDSNGQGFEAAFARFMLRNRHEAMRNLIKVLDIVELGIKEDTAMELSRYLASLWVDAEAAGVISAAARSGGILGLNGNQIAKYTAHRYKERAWPLSDLVDLISVDNTAPTVSDILKVLREHFRKRRIPWVPKKEPDEVIDDYILSQKEPVLVLIPGPGEANQLPDEALLAELRAYNPKLIYIFGTGPRLPDWLPDGLEPLLPPLDVDVEKKQLNTFCDVIALISRKYRSL